jgi:hypothetical protein
MIISIREGAVTTQAQARLARCASRVLESSGPDRRGVHLRAMMIMRSLAGANCLANGSGAFRLAPPTTLRAVVTANTVFCRRTAF